MHAKKNFVSPFLRHLIPNAGTIALVAILLFTYHTWASPTSQNSSGSSSVISYQGSLTNELGQPINESMPITFRIYESESSSTALWTEIHADANALVVQNGQFQAWLGSLTPFSTDLWNHPSLYLGIQIDSDVEMSPRQRLGSMPHAFQAATALSVPDRSISSAKLGLQQHFQSLTSNGPITVTATMTHGIGIEIPGSEMLIELDRASRLLLTVQAIARYSEPSGDNVIQVVVDDVPVQRAITRDQTLDTVHILTHLDLTAGSHRITLNYHGSTLGTQLELQGTASESSLGYLVIDQP